MIIAMCHKVRITGAIVIPRAGLGPGGQRRHVAGDGGGDDECRDQVLCAGRPTCGHALGIVRLLPVRRPFRLDLAYHQRNRRNADRDALPSNEGRPSSRAG